MKFDLVELLNYLGLHGKTAIVILIIGFIVWILFSNNKASNFLIRKLVERFSKVLTSIHKEKELASEKVSLEIDKILASLREETDATNALVIRYRNGSYDSIGSSILKFYATNEKTKPGYLQIGNNIQNISRSLYGNFCDDLLRKHKIYIKDKDSIDENPNEVLSLMKLFGDAEKFYARALVTTSDQQIIGFVCLVYAENQKVAESRIDAALTEKAARIVSKLEMVI